MKIMYLIYSYTAGGGIETLLRDLMHGMVQKGHSVCLCVINHDYDEAMLRSLDPEIRVILLERPPRSGGQARYMRRFASIVRRERIDILHCQGINCVIFSALAKLYRPQLRILNTVHDNGNYSSYSALKVFLGNCLLDQTIAISDSVKSEILARHVPAEKVITLYNAIDTEKFQCEANASRHSLEIGNVARLFPVKKGQDTLIHAAMLLIPDYPDLRCRFAGNMFKGQEREIQKLRDEVREKGLSEQITFLGNIDDVPAFLHSLDVFVLPSNYEGFGIALIEAIAAGVPCVASDLEGPHEIFKLAQKDGVKIGLLCSAGDASAFAAAIRTVANTRETYHPKEMVAFVERHFSIGHSVEAHLELYQSLLPTASS